MQKSKYLVANERDALWGLTVSTVGYDELSEDEPYPCLLYTSPSPLDM